MTNTVQPGQTVDHDYVVASDKFGGTFDWPSPASLVAAGGYDSHFAAMKTFWDTRLAGITQLRELPDRRLVDAYRSGYIQTQIVKDGTHLNVGENGYDQLFDHDLLAIESTLFEQGDTGAGPAYLDDVFHNQYADAGYKFSWPFAVYLWKTGDSATVRSHFDRIRTETHTIETDRTGPGGTMAAANIPDQVGNWTIGNASALLGLVTYGYLARQLGETGEATWAANQYTSLLAAVNAELNATISANNIHYLPCEVQAATTFNRCYSNEANWAGTFLFGRWAWDGYLFGAAQSGPLIDLIDATYDYGFGRLKGVLPAHTYGAYPGISSAYNAGYGSWGLRGERYRTEGIEDYLYMVDRTMSGPFAWWEGIDQVEPSAWAGTSHTVHGFGSSPHMWGQANATKVLLESLATETIDGTVRVGRGVPDRWVAPGKVIDVDNVALTGNRRSGFRIVSAGSTVTLTRTGATPVGPVVFELPAFRDNIVGASTGTVDEANGTVTVPATTTTVTVSLAGAVNDPAGPVFDGFENGTEAWTPDGGTWTGCVQTTATTSHAYCKTSTADNVSLNSGYRVADGSVQAFVTLDQLNRPAGGCVVGRARDATHYDTLCLTHGADGTDVWEMYERNGTAWKWLAGGPIRLNAGHPYLLRLDLVGNQLTASYSLDDGVTIVKLGSGTGATYTEGSVGVRSFNTAASFDNVTVGRGPEQVLEAESAALSGGASVNTSWPGYSGTGFVAGFQTRGAATTFTVDAPDAGAYDVALRYANGPDPFAGSKTLSVYVNDVKQRTTALPSTGTWDVWASRAESLTLRAGVNTISYRHDADDDGNVNLDRIDVTQNRQVLEAEAGNRSGAVIRRSAAGGFTGSGYLTGFQTTGSAASFPVDVPDPGAYTVALRYANGANGPVTLSAYLNGAKVRQVTFPATGGPGTWQEATISLDLAANHNTITLRVDATDTGRVNLDRLRILPQAAATTYQAEDATLTGGASFNNSWPAYQGSGFVAGYGTVGATTTFNVKTPADRAYAIEIRYANGPFPRVETKTVSLYVQGVKVRQIVLPTTGATSTDWANWATTLEPVTLHAGNNAVALRHDPDDTGDVNLDAITLVAY